MRLCWPAGAASCSAGNAQLPLPPMLMFDRITEISETGGANGKGVIRAELDVQPGPLVLRLPLQGRSGHAGLPRPRRALAAGRLLSRLARLAGPRPRARRRRGEVHRPGSADRQEGRLRRRPQARLPRPSSCSASPTAGSKRTARASTRPRTCGSACSSRSADRQPEPGIRPCAASGRSAVRARTSSETA